MVSKAVPQDLLFGPIVFQCLYDNLCDNMSEASHHFYADDTVLLLSNFIIQAFEYLQSVSNVLQSHLQKLKIGPDCRQNQTDGVLE